MASGIEYGGVLKNKYEGTLFNGVKFFVGHRVPLRKDIIGKIKENGGKLVNLDKHADVLIFDHAKKFEAPANSVSWQYIDDCVNQGTLVDIEQYRIQKSAPAPRPTQRASGTKTPFTHQDERLLVTWVLQARRSGNELSGNKIYQELEEHYPHHTWQSWRDKWVKQISKLPEDKWPQPLEELPPSAHPATSAANSTAATSTPARPTASSTPILPSGLRPVPIPAYLREIVDEVYLNGDQADRDHANRENRRNSGPRVPFSPDDDQILMEYVPACQLLGFKDLGALIYGPLALFYPHHTAQSWRERYKVFVRPYMPEEPPAPRAELKKVIRHLIEQQHKKEKTTAPVPPLPSQRRLVSEREPAETTATPVQPRPSRQPATAEPETAARAPRSTDAEAATNSSKLEELERRAQEFRERMQLHGDRPVLSQAAPQGHLNRQVRAEPESCRSAQAPVNNELQEEVDASEQESDEESDAFEPVPDEEVDPVEPEADQEPDASELESAEAPSQAIQLASRSKAASPKEEFWTFFGVYAESLDEKPVPWTQIGGRSVDLWDLWRVATMQPNHVHRDWQLVVEQLDIDWVQQSDAPQQAKAAFEKHLLGYEIWKREFDEAPDRELEEDDLEEEEAERGVEDEDVEDGEDGEQDEDYEQQEEEEELGEMEEGQDEEYEEEQLEDEELGEAVEESNFKSSPPPGVKRPRHSSVTSPYEPLRKRTRYDEGSEVPETPHDRIRHPPENQRLPVRSSQTPSRRVRIEYRSSPVVAETQDIVAAETQGDITPSRQLMSELEVASHSRPRHLREDEELGSSDRSSSPYFMPIEDIPLKPGPKPPVIRPSQPSRVPSSTRTPQTSRVPSLSRAPSREVLQFSTPLPRQRAASSTHPAQQPAPSSSHRTSLSRSATPSHHHPGSSQPRPKRSPVNPLVLVDDLTKKHGYDSAIAVRAVHATTCDKAKALMVAEILTDGDDLPSREKGVWTERDDEDLRSIGEVVDRMGGKVPAPGDMEPFGRRVLVFEKFARLEKKHGARAVFERRVFLKSWDKA